MLSAERREREIGRCADAINDGAKLFLVCCGLEDCHGVPLGHRIMEGASVGQPAVAVPRSPEWTLAQMARGGPFPVSDPRWCKVTASGTESGFYAYDRENASTVAALAADLEAVEPPRTFVFGADRGTVHVECQHGFVSVVGGVPKEPACVDPGCVEDACGWWEREKHWLDRETPVVSDGTAASYASVLLDSLPPPLPPPADTPGAASSRARGPSAASGGSLGAMPPAGRSQVRLCPPHVSLPPPEHQCEWREAVCGHCPRTWRTCAPDNNPSKGCGAEWGCGTDHVCTPEWSGSALAS